MQTLAGILTQVQELAALAGAYAERAVILFAGDQPADRPDDYLRGASFA